MQPDTAPHQKYQPCDPCETAETNHDVPKRKRRIAPSLQADTSRLSSSHAFDQKTYHGSFRGPINNGVSGADTAESVPALDLSRTPSAAERETSDLGGFDYLLAKYPPRPDDDECLPLYGDSDDENQYDEDTWEEIQQEQQERVQASNVMSRREVTSVIDAEIKNFKQQWNQNRLPNVQTKACRMWKKLTEVKARRLNRSRIKNLNDADKARLEMLRQAIERHDWHKTAAVRDQCQSMKETVYAILEGHHFLEVLDQEWPPTKANRRAIRSNPKPRVALPEGEEVLDSEDDIDTFTVSDSSPTEDIPFASEVAVNPVPYAPPERHREPPASLPTKYAPRKARELPIRFGAVEESGAEADAESDAGNRILSLARRQHRSPLSMSTAKSKKPSTVGNKEPIRPPDYSLESGSDTDPPRLPDTKYKGLGCSKSQAIDLTFSDSAEQEKEATSSKRSGPSMASSRKPTKRTSNSKILRSPLLKNSPCAGADRLPAIEDVTGMRKLAWQAIEVPPDRVRTLSKGVYCIKKLEFRNLYRYTRTIQHPHCRMGQVLRTYLAQTKDETSNESHADQLAAWLLTSLFMTYVCGKNLIENTIPSHIDLERSLKSIDNSSTSFITHLEQAFGFYNNLLSIQGAAKRRTKRNAEEAERQELACDDNRDLIASDEETMQSQPHKKRKHAVLEL
jgi:hypothetical protein